MNKGSIFITANEVRRLLFLSAKGLYIETYEALRRGNPDKNKKLKIFYKAMEKRLLARLKMACEAENIVMEDLACELLRHKTLSAERLKQNGGRTSPNYKRTVQGLRTIKRRVVNGEPEDASKTS